MSLPEMAPGTPEAYQLLHEGALAMAQIEANGMAVDVPYIEKAMVRTHRRVERMTAVLEASEVMRLWRRTYGAQTNIDSPEQLGCILFEKMGFAAPKFTASDRYSTDEDALIDIDHPFVEAYLDRKKLHKAVNTNLKAILREAVGGLVHCFFDLHTVASYRSSSSELNFQNQPIRDPDLADLIRSAFVSRPGRELVETDFKGAEVCVSACYHKDPRMIEYILDPSKDLHRDMAAELFKLEGKVPKAVRNTAKGMFVFAEFYGDYYIKVANNLWKSIRRQNLVTEDGTPLYDWLASRGITELGDLDPKSRPRAGTFEQHVCKTEDRFWNERFPVYTQWKKDWYAAYCEKAGFQTLTGFTCRGYMRKNQVINYPVQGSSFHCLLWSLCRVMERMRKYKMKTLIVGQIHDSILADVVPKERADYLGIVNDVVSNELPKYWPWLIVPITVEVEASPLNGSWAEKKKVD